MSEKPKKTLKGIYMKNILTRKINVPFVVLGNNIKEILSRKVSETFEGRCIKEGFVKKNSCNIIQYSAGILKSKHVEFHVMFDCLICRPCEGMKFKVIVKNITKAGIRAEYKDKDSPIVVFISRDHVYNNKYFSSINIDDVVHVKVIGVRYELNDEFISIIADLAEKKIKKRPKITLKGKDK
jgi:DNA-directed RNA polymerase subunit E'/Rpb7